MATLVSTHKISKSYASKNLFQEISFAVDENERIGLIGPNGAGKSTLLRLIAKESNPDSGKISFANHLRLGYVNQKPSFNADETILSSLLGAVDDPYDSENIQRAYELISKLELDQFFESSEKLVQTLSGGWQKKVAIARELMKTPNLLLLDEPTNHLDLDSILWLEKFLNESTSLAILTVTHDRRFLQSTCRTIFDLDPQLPYGLLRTNGRYDTHLESKMQLLEGQKRLEEKRRNSMSIEKEWLSRGPQARLTKQKARIERAHHLIDEVAELKSKNRQTQLQLDFGTLEKSPKKLIAAEQIEKSLSQQILFKDFSCLVGPKHRYGLIGRNGCGKSTLLRCLIGQDSVDSGTVFANPDISISYFEQGKDNIDPNQSVLRTICPDGDYVHFQGQPVFARSYLSRFQFNSQQADSPVSRLSGGELSRLILARLMLTKAHVLILDEPTNDLDVSSLEALSECLSEFQGAVILVSHDRYFLDQNCDSIWAFDSSTKEILTFADTFQWEDWRAQRNQYKNQKQNTKPKQSDSKSNPITNRNQKGLSQKERRELADIEKQINTAEEKLRLFQAKLNHPDVQKEFQHLNEISTAIAKQEEEIAALLGRWEELSQRVNKV